MRKINYEQKKQDLLYLKSIIPVEDIVTIMDVVEDLMANPTKRFAASMYESQIGLWFEERGCSLHRGFGSELGKCLRVTEFQMKKIEEIANRYHLSFCPLDYITENSS